MENTLQNSLAVAQNDFVAWCLPSATNTEVLLQATQIFNQFSQYMIALLTLIMLLVMCVTLYTTLLSLKYKETTRHDWIVLGGAFGATMLMIYFWDFMRALHTVLAPSPEVMFTMLWVILLFNTVFVGYYAWGALRSLTAHTRRHIRKVLFHFDAWRRKK